MVAASAEGITIALTTELTPELRAGGGFARELVSRIQNLRKENGLEVSDPDPARLFGSRTLPRGA